MNSDRLFGVTALSHHDAWAVGSYLVLRPGHGFSPERTLVLHWHGMVWKRVRSPNPSERNPSTSRHDDSLLSVHALSARNAWAVGTYFRRATTGRHSYQTL